MKKINLIIIILCIMLMLGGCTKEESAFTDFIFSALGIDNTDYQSETVISILDTSSAQVQTLVDTAKVLCYGSKDGKVICFEKFSDVSGDYIDVVLNYLAGTFYSEYSADESLMDTFSENYPELSVNTLIPQTDYENEVYSVFGGKKKAVNKSTSTYTYLDKIDAYLLTGRLNITEVTCTVYEASETEHTYKMTVSFYINGDPGEKYDILFMKREDGTAYILNVAKSKKIIVLPETAEPETNITDSIETGK